MAARKLPFPLLLEDYLYIIQITVYCDTWNSPIDQFYRL